MTGGDPPPWPLPSLFDRGPLRRARWHQNVHRWGGLPGSDCPPDDVVHFNLSCLISVLFSWGPGATWHQRDPWKGWTWGSATSLCLSPSGTSGHWGLWARPWWVSLCKFCPTWSRRTEHRPQGSREEAAGSSHWPLGCLNPYPFRVVTVTVPVSAFRARWPSR